ncbi:hypothetical protein [Pararobbsia silviterrae]|uniref:Transmembrane lipoprotein n=1 Tax=Pararobbsia silviterrae TaxID=1792498 RepID=A0A494X3Y2_9BURK|nr:hypothetical protein [Pararobbsia silviterrae]RKP45050.1 hypothetical protein D7S86_26830 [Pararobbsia silviterrae]
MTLRLWSTAVLTLPLSVALAGLFAWTMPGGWHRSALLAMVLFFPLWIGIFCSVFALTTTRRAIIGLGVGNLAAFALLYAARALLA